MEEETWLWFVKQQHDVGVVVFEELSETVCLWPALMTKIMSLFVAPAHHIMRHQIEHHQQKQQQTEQPQPQPQPQKKKKSNQIEI